MTAIWTTLGGAKGILAYARVQKKRNRRNTKFIHKTVESTKQFCNPALSGRSSSTSHSWKQGLRSRGPNQNTKCMYIYIYMCVTPVFYTRIYNLIKIYSLCVTFLGEMIYNILGKKNMCIATLQLLEMNLEIPNDLGKNSNDFGEKSILTT